MRHFFSAYYLVRKESYNEDERTKDSGLILENDDDALRDKGNKGELECLNDIDEEIQREICAASSESAADGTTGRPIP
jgi:hypothetical protein